MSLSYSIDWLAVSDPKLLDRSDIFSAAVLQASDRQTPPLRGYNRSINLQHGRVDWHSERDSQRRLWTFTGADLRALAESGTDNRAMIERVVAIHQGRITRLDFAIDVRGVGALPGDIENAWRSGTLQTHARKLTVTQSERADSKRPAKTVYLGSRQSASFLRVYDKGAEQKTWEDWTRIEVEMKDPLAGKVGAAMVEIGIPAAGCAAVKRAAYSDAIPWYADALTGAGEVDMAAGKKDTDWEKWIWSIAMPNVIKAMYRVDGVAEYMLDQISLWQAETGAN